MTISNINPNPQDPGAVTPSPLSGYERVPIISGGPIEQGSTVAAIADTALVDQSVTATGTTRADAYAIVAQITNFTTVGSGTGAVLNTATKPGIHRIIFNAGSNPLTVYALGTDTIDGVAGATGVTLTNALRCEFFCVASGKWVSAKLGATST